MGETETKTDDVSDGESLRIEDTTRLPGPWDDEPGVIGFFASGAAKTEAIAATRTATSIDKSAWPRGPWDTEPDFREWASAVPPHYACQIQRNEETGALCGYVAVPPGHPAHGWRYQDNFDDGSRRFRQRCYFDVHGGVTLTEPGVGGLWVIGFDCGHPLMGDRKPGIEGLCALVMVYPAARSLMSGSEYRDLPYVREQCESLARQLAALDKAAP